VPVFVPRNKRKVDWVREIIFIVEKPLGTPCSLSQIQETPEKYTLNKAESSFE